MNKNIFLSLVLLTTFLFSCSKYGYVRLNYPLSPVAYLPENVKTIAVINRSLTKEQDKSKNITESIVTAEVAGSDRKASDECLKGVFDGINGWKGIQIVIPTKTRYYGTGTRQVPELLDWKEVRSVCDSTKADALLVLETFDSNSDLAVSTVTHQLDNVIHGNDVKPSVPSHGTMNVYSFWRLYNPATKNIADEYQSTTFLGFDVTVSTIALVLPDVLRKTSYAAGKQYVQRFLPGYYTVQREFFKRGKGSCKRDFENAFRKTEVANWQGAIDIWNELAKHPNRKNAGRACLNIAVANEVLGNTDVALPWAKKSYEDYDIKLAREYSSILQDRIKVEK